MVSNVMAESVVDSNGSARWRSLQNAAKVGRPFPTHRRHCQDQVTDAEGKQHCSIADAQAFDITGI